MKESEGNIAGIRVAGTLHQRDYEMLIPRLENLFAEHGKLRVLFLAEPDFKGWDLSAAWQDAALGFQHAADFERLAVVGAPEWVEWCVRLSAFLFKGDVRIFAQDELQEAWDWIRS
jgi:hypothetical protein